MVVADRYTTSNAVHQCSKLPEVEWTVFLDWLFDYEYRLLGIPVPDVLVYLQVDPPVSQKLMTGRYHGDEAKKDIHESTLDYLIRSRMAAEYCRDRLDWRTMHCVQGETMHSIEEIHTEVMELLKHI